MAKVNLKHSGAVIDQQIDRVLDGSVVVDNTLSTLDLESKKPVDSEGIANAIETASNNLKARGYIYMGVATPTTTPNVSGGKVFYLAAQAGEYTNFGYTLPTDALTSLEWDGKRWHGIRIIDLVTPAEVEQAILDNTASEVTEDGAKPVSGAGIASAIETASNSLKERGYIYMGVATPTTTPDISGGKVFYLAAQAGKYPNFDTTIASDMLTSLAWNGERWIAARIADLVTPAEVEQAILDNTAKKIEKGEAMPVASEVVAEALEARDKQLENKADKTEYYPEMAVGIADNLRGRGEAKEEIYTYRPSAGSKNSIADEGIATVKRLKGNTIVYNQLHIGNWPTIIDGTKVTNSDGSITLTAASTSLAVIDEHFKYTVGHKYLMSISAKLDTTDTKASISIYGYTPVSIEGITSTQYSNISVINEAVSGPYHLMRVGIDSGQEGVSVTFKNWQCFDLTQMFGAGNEPSTVEEFKALFPNDYYDYNSGELRSMNVEGIITNGFNQFNGEYAEVLANYTYYFGGQYASIGFAKELGGTLEEIVIPEDKLYTPINKGYIYATGTNICINLSHSGVNNGNYEPYNERRRELSEVAQYFPEGMRSAGSVYDEINETEAIQRVGVRAYEEGDDDNSEVMTDGINTVYPLTEPIVTPLPTRRINLNYAVWDWGTEKAVSSKLSAPFRADIVYGFNAVDTIRINKLDIEALMLRVAELEAKIAETSTTTMEEENL